MILLEKGRGFSSKGHLILDLPLENETNSCSHPGCTPSIVYHIQQNPAFFPDHGLAEQTIQGVATLLRSTREGILLVYPLALHDPRLHRAA